MKEPLIQSNRYNLRPCSPVCQRTMQTPSGCRSRLYCQSERISAGRLVKPAISYITSVPVFPE